MNKNLIKLLIIDTLLLVIVSSNIQVYAKVKDNSDVKILTTSISNEDTPETIYDLYSQEEIEILFRIVEAECTGGDIESKKHVANVIINRVQSKDFPNTIKEVVFQKVGNTYQFSPIADKRYYKVDVTDETIQACEEIFLEEESTYGSLFFDYCPNSWASRNRTYTFSDKLHNFYK